jgi:hypothetical protein
MEAARRIFAESIQKIDTVFLKEMKELLLTNVIA